MIHQKVVEFCVVAKLKYVVNLFSKKYSLLWMLKTTLFLHVHLFPFIIIIAPITIMGITGVKEIVFHYHMNTIDYILLRLSWNTNKNSLLFISSNIIFHHNNLSQYYFNTFLWCYNSFFSSPCFDIFCKNWIIHVL